MSVGTETGQWVSQQANRIRSSKPPEPEIPRDNVDPLAPAPPPPAGSIVERFGVPGPTTKTNPWPVVLLFGVFATIILYRRFP